MVIIKRANVRIIKVPEEEERERMRLILGGLHLQQLEAGFLFPNQRLKSGCSSECAES